MAKKEVTKHPTGLSITRNNYKFTFAWKIGDKDYKDGQKLEYRLKIDGKWRKWHDISIKATTKSKTHECDVNYYKPYKNNCLNEIEFRVKGNRDKYTTGSGKNKKTHNPTWSEFKKATKSFKLYKPNKPTLTETFEDEFWNKVVFSWETSVDNTNHNPFHNVYYQTALIKEGDKLDWTKISKVSAGANGSMEFIENTNTLALGSYTRWFRVWSVGMGGESDAVTKKHVFAEPYTPKNIKVSSSKRAIGYDVIVQWEVSQSATRPIDKVIVQYAIATPDAGMLPYNPSWTDAVTAKDTSGKDKAKFIVDQTLGFDEVLYVRVLAQHDTEHSQSVSSPVIVEKGELSKPTDLSIEKDDKTFNITISADNESDVGNSYLEVFWRNDKKAKEKLIGIIPHGVKERTFKCDDWSKLKSMQVGVRARADSTSRGSMFSDFTWTNWTIPVTEETSGATGNAPTNITVAKTSVPTRVLVSWKYTWDKATGMQITWADSQEAWSSTQQPSSYDVETKVAKWNIDGLEVGKKWYIRLRQIWDNEGTKVYSNWSNIVSIDLADIPDTPVAPSNLKVESSQNLEEVVLTWKNEWDGIDGAEISWATDPNAWISTNAPETFSVDTVAERWIVAGLETGNTWHFRVRSKKDDIFSPYSEIVSLDYSSVPEKPILLLTESVIDISGTTTATWGYSTTDESLQQYAEICLATIDGNGVTYGDVIVHATTMQSATLSAADLGWQYGETYALCVRVVSSSGLVSEWSDPVLVSIAEQLTCEITQVSLAQKTIEEDEDTHETRTVEALVEMPMTITVTGAGETGITSVAIERAQSYSLERPDENEFNGFEGETVFDFSQAGEAQITITNEMLSGFLDDGAQYRIVASVRDSMGRIATVTRPFEVHWTHQAVMPIAEVEMNTEDIYAIIDIKKPEGAAEGDVVDIYRLSADKPVLIVKGGEFDTQYVDPYPTIGEYGGHRIVYRTANGDYITEDNTLAWVDMGEDEGDTLDIDYAILDFGGERIMLHYNVDAEHSWDKDFKETHYLGGSVEGDWNAAVGRSGSISSVAITLLDSDTIRSIRRLAVYTGACNVRTKDGSNFWANVDVKEQRSHENEYIVPQFSFDVTRVDPVGLDGVKYVDFLKGTFRMLDENGDALMDENGNYLYGVFESDEEQE
ncbi:MAG TPA: hypothetical protein DCG33_04120 [Prevotellaceae bacterium]|nr:hypothetical protein [Prevotellaceae bacterium]